MRHHNQNRKFGRKTDARRALMKSLCEELIKHGRISTTLAKAKELRPVIEKLVTKAQSGTVDARRQVSSQLATDKCTKKLVDEIAPRYKERKGGYTRITRTEVRAGDASQQAIIEFV